MKENKAVSGKGVQGWDEDASFEEDGQKRSL